jgi:phage shock protein A
MSQQAIEEKLKEITDGLNAVKEQTAQLEKMIKNLQRRLANLKKEHPAAPPSAGNSGENR